MHLPHAVSLMSLENPLLETKMIKNTTRKKTNLVLMVTIKGQFFPKQNLESSQKEKKVLDVILLHNAINYCTATPILKIPSSHAECFCYAIEIISL